MARSFGKVFASIWGDDDFRSLSPDAQRLYVLLCSQSRLTLAGSLDLMPSRWAALANGTTVSDIEAALAELEGARFIVIDRATEELVVRTLVRHDLEPGRLNRNLIKGLWTAWSGILSETLRKVVVDNVPEIVWEKSGDLTPTDAQQMRTSPRLELPVATGRPDHQSKPPVETTGSDDQSEPPSPSPSRLSGRVSPPAAATNVSRADCPPPDEPMTAAAGDAQPSSEDVLTEAAKLVAWAETDRRYAAGDIGSPEGYQRSRVNPLRRQHEATWRESLATDPSLTARDLADLVAGTPRANGDRTPWGERIDHTHDEYQRTQRQRAEENMAQVADLQEHSRDRDLNLRGIEATRALLHPQTGDPA